MLIQEAAFFGLSSDEIGWRPDYDLNQDGIISVSDLQAMTQYLGRTCVSQGGG